MRRDGLPVYRNYNGAELLEIEAEYPRIGGIDQTQSNALAGPDRKCLQQLTVYCHRIAHTPVVAHITSIAEIVTDLR